MCVCVQVNPYFIPQKHESNQEEPGIHAQAVSANANAKLWVYTQKENTVAKSEKKDYINNIIFHLLLVNHNTDQRKNLVLKCNLVLA